MEQLIERAADFARKAHAQQTRKYTGEPYFNHCAEVAELVKSVNGTNEMVAAAYLHDVVEDCNVPLTDIYDFFGVRVGVLVERLTDVSRPHHGNRKARKAVDTAHLAFGTPEAKTIKLADLISNTRTIVPYDPNFARVYLREKAELLKVLTDGNKQLYKQAEKMLKEGCEILGIKL